MGAQPEIQLDSLLKALGKIKDELADKSDRILRVSRITLMRRFRVQVHAASW